jgi:NodT family efflux transporter outer membrane factor (OMF) lipoprotein
MVDSKIEMQILRWGPLARFLSAVLLALMAACAPVGPDYVRPEVTVDQQWAEYVEDEFQFVPQDSSDWWKILGDPVLDQLIESAYQQNNNVKVAGLRVLEARAALGIAVGNQYPQSQVAFGDATRISASESNANTGGGGDLNYLQYNLGAGASWEIDFWGRFRRGIESADANLLATVASFDDTLVLLTAQVVDTYAVLRTTEEQLRIGRENLVLQQRSYDIVEVLFRNGASSELDVQQAETLLLSTMATIPSLEVTLYQSHHALSVLLGMSPTYLSDMIGGEGAIPSIPAKLTVGVPADLLRQRPDVRRAELFAVAQNAQVGVATANLYPSFSISGSLGFAAAGDTDTTRTGDSGIGELFRAESLTYAVGPSFVWPFLNYGRIKNNIRVQDARLQQALVQYRETVIQAEREVVDAMVTYVGSQQQDDILMSAVESAKRSSTLSMLRYKEGFADYQRVLDAQQALFAQQQRYISNKGVAVRSIAQVYRALGGGWQNNNVSFIDDATRDEMEQRVDWGEMLETDRANIIEENESRN